MKCFIIVILLSVLLPFSYGNSPFYLHQFVESDRVINFNISAHPRNKTTIYSPAKPPITRADRMRHWSQFIIGGTEVQDFSQFAYQLSLRYVEVHVCGASIIARQWALSAGEL